MKDRLVTPGYCFILAANFLLYFGFWLLIPVLPFYLCASVRSPAIFWTALPVNRCICWLTSSL